MLPLILQHRKEFMITLNFSIDREKRPFYNFIATVFDEGGLFSSANINLEILDVNDNPPRFSRSGNFSDFFLRKLLIATMLKTILAPRR